MKKGFHTSNYGKFSGIIPSDMDGYAYTTQAGWMRASIDWGGLHKRGCRGLRLEHCKELARRTREAIRKAKKELAEWRKSSR